MKINWWRSQQLGAATNPANFCRCMQILCKLRASFIRGRFILFWKIVEKNTENDNRSINGTRMGRTRADTNSSTRWQHRHSGTRPFGGGGEEKNMKNMFHSPNLPRYTPTSVENVVIPCPLDGSVGGHFDLYPNVNLELCYDTERTFEINMRPFFVVPPIDTVTRS